ncbi:MAG: AAA family ATPase [Clostridia bacterium]|nr:AAA family ATPase [Clostridia bacterium]MBQ9778733.1 AAA family ATPase [Clostridia bacterium]
MKNKLVAIVGMCGTGKSDATEWFVERGWQRIYFGQVTMDELAREGLPVTPENERYEREKLRREYGMAAYAVKSKDKILSYLEKGHVVLDGLYSWDEYKYIIENVCDELTVVAVMTDRALRYARLTNRPVRPLTREQAVARDYSEIENLAKGGPISIADRFITNNGGRDEFRASIMAVIDELEA